MGGWSHVAVTYDGATLRLFVNGAQASQLVVAGSIATSASALHIGGNGVWGEWFNGTIDEVRVYNRALERRRDPERHGPQHHAGHGRADDHGADADARRGRDQRRHLGHRPVQRADGRRLLHRLELPAEGRANVVVPRRHLRPGDEHRDADAAERSQYGATYKITVKGGAGGVTDLAGNPLAADSNWSFSVEASPPPILVVGSTGNPFGAYVGEILRNEGLHAFTTIDVAFVSPALLAQFDVVILGDTALTPAQVTTLTGWVNGGGNLVAMRPDKQLAGLLGLTDAGTTLRTPTSRSPPPPSRVPASSAARSSSTARPTATR